MAFAKASNKALTQKVGALLLSIHKYNRIFEFLHLCKYNESKVRAYISVDGAKYYGAFSSVKSARAK